MNEDREQVQRLLRTGQKLCKRITQFELALKVVARAPNCWCPKEVVHLSDGVIHTEACDFAFRLLNGNSRGNEYGIQRKK